MPLAHHVRIMAAFRKADTMEDVESPWTYGCQLWLVNLGNFYGAGDVPKARIWNAAI